jgi:hypothetical protein
MTEVCLIIFQSYPRCLRSCRLKKRCMIQIDVISMEISWATKAATSSVAGSHRSTKSLLTDQHTKELFFSALKRVLLTCECFKWPATAIIIPVRGKPAESLGKTATVPDAPPSVFAFFVGGGPRLGGRMRAGRCFAFFCFWNHCIWRRRFRVSSSRLQTSIGGVSRRYWQAEAFLPLGQPLHSKPKSHY